MPRVLAVVATAALLCSCTATKGGDALVGTLVDGVPLSVTLVSQITVPLDELPPFRVSGLAAGFELEWATATPPCLVAEVSGARADGVVEIQLKRSPSTLALCIDMQIGNRFVIRANNLEAGTYQVRLIDEQWSSPPREVGRRTVVVSSE